MEAHIFDGQKEAYVREALLEQKIRKHHLKPRLVSVVFREDDASQLYTRLKFEAAVRVGVEFDRIDHSLTDNADLIIDQIQHLCQRQDVDGVMIQKPSKRVFEVTLNRRGNVFDEWWRSLTSSIEPSKDTDCLNRYNLDLVYAGHWRIVPATVKSILSILEIALKPRLGQICLTKVSKGAMPLKGFISTVIGRSDIVGKPLAAVLEQFGAKVALVGSGVDDLGALTIGADIVVTATGQENLIQEDLVKPGVILIDVGSPKSEVHFDSVSQEAGFITPVPNGVGPMTVVSLLENLVEMMLAKTEDQAESML